MRIVVAGAGGFIGAACVKELLRRGHSVAVLSRTGNLQSRLIGYNMDRIDVSDGFNTPEFIDSIARFEADAMLNLAWQGVANFARNETSQYENIPLHLAISHAAVEASIPHYVGVGSQAEYGPTDGPVSESQLLLPTTLYGAAKSAAGLGTRALLLNTQTTFTWVRIFSTFGPDDAPHWMIPSIAKQLLKNETIDSTLGTQLWDYLYVDDAARAFATILEHDGGLGFVNLGSGKPVTVRHIIEKMKSITGSNSRLNFGAIDFRHDQVMHLEANISKLKSQTGWEPETPLYDGLELTLHALKNDVLND